MDYIIAEDEFNFSNTEQLSNYTFYNMKADVTQEKFIVQNGRTIKANGKVTINKEKGLCWKILKPFEHIWLFKGAELTEIDDEGNVVTNDSATNNDQLSLFVDISKAFSTGDFKNLSEHFYITLGKTEYVESVGDQQIIYLAPKDELLKKAIFRIAITSITKDSVSYFKEIKILEHNEGYTSLVFQNVVIDKDKLDSKDIEFDNICSLK